MTTPSAGGASAGVPSLKTLWEPPAARVESEEEKAISEAGCLAIRCHHLLLFRLIGARVFRPRLLSPCSTLKNPSGQPSRRQCWENVQFHPVC